MKAPLETSTEARLSTVRLSTGSSETMDYMTMLSTRKPTALQRLIDTVPLPPFSVPRGGLPQWTHIPLDRQIPLTRIPDEIIVFAKNRLGAKLYSQPPGSEFDCWPGTSPEYDPLHDPHLRIFFHNSRSLRLPRLPPCSQQQFSEHRRRLHQIRAKMIKMEMERRDTMARDALLFHKVEEEKEKRRQNFKREEKANESMRRVMESQEEERREKQRELQERQKNMELRIQRVKEMKEARRLEVARKARAREDVIRKRVEASQEIAMKKKVKNLKRMRLADIKLKRSLQQARDNRVRKREEEDLRRWNELKRTQEKRLHQRAEMMRAYTEQLNTRVAEDLKEKAATQRQRDRQLKVIQMTNMKDWADKERDYARELRHKLVDKWRAKQPQPALRKEKKPYPPRELLREAAQSGVCGRSPSAITLDRAGQWLEKWENTPLQVRSTLNAVLARAILSCTRKRVTSMLNVVHNRALAIIKNSIAAAVQPEAQSEDTKKSKSAKQRTTKKQANEPVLSDSQRNMMQDKQDWQQAKSELEKSIVQTRRVMTQIITEHVQRGLDAEAVVITTLPRFGKEPTGVTEEERGLAMLVCHTRASDISITTDLVKSAAEKMTFLAIREIQKSRKDKN